MRKSDVRPIFKKYPFLLPVAGLILILLSPFIMPIFVIVNNTSDVIDYYREALEALKGLKD